MEWVGRQVDALVQAPVDPKGEIVVHVVGDPFPLQDELDDARTSRLREKVFPVRIEPKSIKVKVIFG